MSISNLVDNRTIKPKTKMECQKNKPQCMFYYNGGCTAEWCIFAELPTIVIEERSITCTICNANKKSISLYSGITDNYICSECRAKIDKIINHNTCDRCGKSLEAGKSLCSSCISDLEYDDGE